jgi:acyl carrier protein
MNSETILEELTTILSDLLSDDTISLTMKTARSDIPAWDSFNYIAFMVAVETRFRIKFRASDIESFANVGEIVQRISELKPGP